MTPRQETSLLDGTGEEFVALLSSAASGSLGPDIEPDPGTVATGVVYSCPWAPGPDNLSGAEKRVDELEAGDIIGCAIDDAPGLYLYSAPTPVKGGRADSEGYRQYLVEGSRDGERPCEKHLLWGSQVVTVVTATGWTQAHFRTWSHSKCKVFTAEHTAGLRIERVSFTGVEVKIGGKWTMIAYRDVTGMEQWGTFHAEPSEAYKSRAMDEADKYYGWRGGKHPFRATFAGSLRCKDCSGSIRSTFHTGIRNADSQQFEKLRMRVLRPAQTNVGRTSATEDLDRYVRGIPLIRYDRERDVRWTFVCPVECGGGMWLGWSNLRGLREGWFKHCREKHPQEGPRSGNWQRVWNPTWPADATVERSIVIQPARRGRGSEQYPVAVRVRVPKDDPQWEKVVIRLAAQGRSVSVQEPGAGAPGRHPVMTVAFDDGTAAANDFRTALKRGGIPQCDIELIRKPGRLGECLDEPAAASTPAAPQPLDDHARSGAVADPQEQVTQSLTPIVKGTSGKFDKSDDPTDAFPPEGPARPNADADEVAERETKLARLIRKNPVRPAKAAPEDQLTLF